MSEEGPAPDLRIVLARPKASENVGAAARAMKNFGLCELWLVAPRCRVDRAARALASHAGDVLDAARSVDTLDEALADVHWAVGTSARVRASEAVRTHPPDEGLATLPDRGGALVFGPEDHGLANEELDRCQALIRIPTAAYASINLAQAVNLLAYRWFETRAAAAAAAVPPPETAPREQMERMYRQLVDLWHTIGYTDDQREEATLRLFRGLLDRARPTPRELAALRGLISQAAWAAGRDPERLPGRASGTGSSR
jgi:tRNA/rRNA methyltransferase